MPERDVNDRPDPCCHGPHSRTARPTRRTLTSISGCTFSRPSLGGCRFQSRTSNRWVPSSTTRPALPSEEPPPPGTETTSSPCTRRVSPLNARSPSILTRSAAMRSEPTAVPTISGNLPASMRRRVSRSTSELPDSRRSTATRTSPETAEPARSPDLVGVISTHPLRPVAAARIGCTEELPSIHTWDSSGTNSYRVGTPPSCHPQGARGAEEVRR